MEEVDYLGEWLVRYLKNRDIYFKKIKEVEQKEELLIVTEKERTVTHHLVAFSEDLKPLIETLDVSANNAIVLYNTSENLKSLIAAWKLLVKIKNLIIYFVNPFSKLEKKWLVYPSTHDKITEPGTLKQGLLALFEGVEATSQAEIAQIIK